MTKYRLRILYQHYVAGTLTTQEQLEWKSLLANPDLKQTLEKIVEEGWYDFSDEEIILMDRTIADQIFDQVVALPQKKVRQRALWKPVAAVAAVFIVAALGLYIYTNRSADKQKQFVSPISHIKTGGNKAYLTLANGKRIILTDSKNGTLVAQNGVQITKTNDGQLVYTVIGNKSSSGNDYNIIETPRGGQYQIHLPDGTNVWLNAASSLKYPSVFKGNERKVELKGEAYFEVSINKKMPFKVTINSQTIEVLGTHFNVKGYAEEADTKTTLLEGSVKVVSTYSTTGVLIKPGQQALVKRNGDDQINIVEADMEEVMAWKNNYFRFNNENIESVMRKISRWYDVNVEYDGAISDEEFNGTISRTKNIAQVLKMLEDTQGVHFKIEGRRIVVMK
ncbi:FecR family protein [Pedobacter nyackensis]|uniref:FecR family protein n=1 Tax=Pedobacter nyackensis TaxID=475255 RepID=A0A1W2F689_9SPHI|nr:FecR family protein [Pedobacter nyackensis]SMD17026.1 FecR family protein [Pedobacter nyackensis]